MFNRIEVEGKPWVRYPRHGVGESELQVTNGSIWEGGDITRPGVRLNTGDANMFLQFTPGTLRQLADELYRATAKTDPLATELLTP